MLCYGKDAFPLSGGVMTPETFAHYQTPRWESFPDIDLYMDQVIGILERDLAPFADGEKWITSTMINNYVKQKIISAPQNKKYSRKKTTFLFVVCIFKQFMQLDDIAEFVRRMLAERAPKDAYDFFCDSLDAAMKAIFSDEKPELTFSSDPLEKMCQSACFAFAALIYSRAAYQALASSWDESAPEKAL